METLHCPRCSVAFTHQVLLDTHLKAKCGVKSTADAEETPGDEGDFRPDSMKQELDEEDFVQEEGANKKKNKNNDNKPLDNNDVVIIDQKSLTENIKNDVHISSSANNQQSQQILSLPTPLPSLPPHLVTSLPSPLTSAVNPQLSALFPQPQLASIFQSQPVSTQSQLSSQLTPSSLQTQLTSAQSNGSPSPINVPLLAQLQSSLPLITMLQLQQQQMKSFQENSSATGSEVKVPALPVLPPAAIIQANLFQQLQQQFATNTAVSAEKSPFCPVENETSMSGKESESSVEIIENKKEENISNIDIRKQENELSPPKSRLENILRESDPHFDLGGGLSIYPLKHKPTATAMNYEGKSSDQENTINPKNIPEHLYKLLQSPIKTQTKKEIENINEENEYTDNKDPESMQDQIMAIIKNQEEDDKDEIEEIQSDRECNSPKKKGKDGKIVFV